MRHLRRSVLFIAMVALCTASAAGAHPPDSGRGQQVEPAHRFGGPSGGDLLGEVWVRTFERPDGVDPLTGNCELLARNVVKAHFSDAGTARCTITRHTRAFLYFGTACDNVEPDYYGVTRAEQLACAVASDRSIEAANATVDDGPTIDIVRNRFEVFSPQRTAQLPAGNIFGVPAGPATLTAHAWVALTPKLRLGTHTVTFEVVAPDFGEPFTYRLTLGRGPGRTPAAGVTLGRR